MTYIVRILLILGRNMGDSGDRVWGEQTLGDNLNGALHPYKGVILFGLAGPLMGFLVGATQWLLRIRLARVDGQLTFVSKNSKPEGAVRDSQVR